MNESEETPTWYSRNGPIVWAGLKFVVYLGAFFLLLTSHFGQGELVERFTATIATLTSVILNLFGMETHSEGTRVIGKSFQVQIVNGCNGVYVTALICSAMLATPTSWMVRVLGIALASLSIYVMNLIRAASLFAIGSFRYDWFDFAHVYVWQPVVVLASLAIFVAWTGWSLPEGRRSSG